jgi:hypothetical protein
MHNWIAPGEAAHLAVFAEQEIPANELGNWLDSFPPCARIPVIAALRLRVLAALDEQAMTRH